MQSILATSNPLFHVATNTEYNPGPLSSPSPTREHPVAMQQAPTPAAQSSQQGAQKKASASKTSRERCQQLGACSKAVPWIPVLCSVLTAGALIVWALYTDKIIASLLVVLEKIQTPAGIAAGIWQVVSLLKISVVASVSAVVGLLLLLAIIREQQLRKKRTALTSSDWPHGWRVHMFISATAFFLLLLWLVSAALVACLCLAATSGGVAWVGDMAAARAVRLTIEGNVTSTHSPMNDTVERLNAATAEYKSRMENAPAQFRLAPWFANLERGVPAIMEGASRDIAASSYCPPYCLDMSPLASLMPWVNITTMETCICGQQTLQDLQLQLNQTWIAGLANCIALGVMLLSASWLLVHGVTNCVSARRDHQDVLFFSKQHNPDSQRDSRIRNWMRSSHSPPLGGGLSSGGGFDVKADQQRQTQLLAPELRSSVSPRKPSFKGLANGREDDWPAPRDARAVGDIEQPALRQSDQLLPTATPMLSPMVSTTGLGPPSHTDTMRSSASSNGGQQHQQQQSRRRWR